MEPRTLLLPALLCACGCTCTDGGDDGPGGTAGPPMAMEYVGPNDVAVSFYPYVPPLLDDSTGEFLLGEDGGGSVLAWTVPVGATVELYMSTTGQGFGPCDFDGGACAGILDPVLVLSPVVADDAQCATEAQKTLSLEEEDYGCARFDLPAEMFTEPASIAWQALVYPTVSGVAGFTDCLVRHVAVSAEDSHVKMRDVTDSLGVGTLLTTGNTHTGGMAFVDVNNDYWPDIFVVNGAPHDNRLFFNNGDGTFTEDESGTLSKPEFDLDGITGPDPIESAGVSYADVDNDGDLDLAIPVDNRQQMIGFEPQPYEGGPNLFYLNNGDGTFLEMAEAAGVRDPRGWRNSASAFADYDNDGCIDLFLANWAMATLPAGDNFDRLLHGNCDGTFEDVTDTMPIDPLGRDGLAVFWWDANFDNFPELYVGNNSDEMDLPDFDPRADFYMNEGGVLRDWSELPDSVLSDAWAAMGVDIGDIDGDLDWDFYVTDVWFLDPIPQGNALYLGEAGGEQLSENVCSAHGVCFGYNSWPTNFVDFDNDGWVDLWVGASFGSDPDIMYINRGDGTGTFDPHRQNGWTGHFARAGTASDYDGDGRVDVFLWENHNSYLYRNASPLPENHWIELRLIGTESNAAAIGARVELTAADLTQMRRVSGADSAHSQMDLAVHFGLGTELAADQIDIFWPSGNIETLTNVQGDRFLLVREGAGIVLPGFPTAEAVWDGGSSTLLVTATSNYGGRAHIDAVGYGPLVWDRTAGQYEGAFPLASAPTEVQLAHDFGGNHITVPVQ